MLGEIIAQEITSLEKEKTCTCHNCMYNQALRAAALYKTNTSCQCPVCRNTVTTLQRYVPALITYADICEAQEKEIEELEGRLILTPTELEHVPIQKIAYEKNSAAVTVLAQTILHMTEDFKLFAEAAHQAYDIVRDSTVTNLTQAASAAVSAILEPPPNPTDLN